MASRWIVQNHGLANGPVTFHELAGLVRDGRLADHDFVRRHDEDDWLPVEAVAGLQRMAHRLSRDGEAEVETARRTRQERAAAEQAAAEETERAAEAAAESAERRRSAAMFVLTKLVPIAGGLVAAYFAWQTITYDPMDFRNFEGGDGPSPPSIPQQSPPPSAAD